MTSKLTRVLRALYCEPWLIRPEMHEQLCRIAWAHSTGAAHTAEGILANFEDDKKNNSRSIYTVGRVGVICATGVIGRKFASCLNSSGVTSVDVMERAIADAAADPDVDAIVLDIDSPGGVVTGVPECAETVERACTMKPVVAFTGGMMASAAYWISASADAIYAAPSADVGSIGVYTALLDISRKLEMEGIEVQLFKQGKFKAMGMPGVPLTEDQKEHIQEGVDEIADWFKGFVRSARRRVKEEAMEGQTFLGKNAMAVGLVDRIGTLDDAIAYATEEAARRR